MKTEIRWASVATVAIIALTGGVGCASLGDGKLEPITKTTIGLGATAASIAAPEYAGEIKAVKNKLVSMGEDPVAAKTAEQVAAVMQAAGYGRVYTVFFDGIVINDFSRFTYRDAWEKTGTGATVDPAEMIEGATGGAVDDVESDADAKLDATLEKYEASKKAK